MEGTFVTAESAVTSGANGAAAIGGVVGKNENSGKVNLANSLGVTNGEGVDNVGGIAGDNSGTMYSLYNEKRRDRAKHNVGGVAGNQQRRDRKTPSNTTGITATGDYAGGLAGVNSGTIDSGRNTGTINGKDYVGGMVGQKRKGRRYRRHTQEPLERRHRGYIRQRQRRRHRGKQRRLDNERQQFDQRRHGQRHAVRRRHSWREQRKDRKRPE